MKMLINSQNSVFGKFLAHRLSIDGNDVTLVGSDAEMVDRVEFTPYDLVLIIATRSYTGADSPLPSVSRSSKVLLLSTVCDEQTVIEAYQMGVSSYMSLPVNPTRLIRHIRKL